MKTTLVVVTSLRAEFISFFGILGHHDLRISKIIIDDSVSGDDIAQTIKNFFFSKISYSFKLHYKFSLFAISPIESLYFMLTLSVVSSVLSCSQPSCCHREKMVSTFFCR